MKKKYTYSQITLTVFIMLLAIVFTGCKTPQNVSYFQDIAEETLVLPSTGDIKIAPNDKLSILVKTMDPSLSALFNLNAINDRLGEGSIYTTASGTLKSAMPQSTGVSRYTVSPDGTIDMPVVGVIKAAGLTRSELAYYIKGELVGKDLAKDPVVTVEFINMGFSILGEVKQPGRYDINQDRISIIEGLSMAGDLTLQGQRENVAVIREKDGEVKTYRVDLTNYKELAQSPVYFLQQGDIVYVEPNEMQKRQTTINGNNVYSTSFWISVASLLTSVVTTIGVFVLK